MVSVLQKLVQAADVHPVAEIGAGHYPASCSAQPLRIDCNLSVRTAPEPVCVDVLLKPALPVEEEKVDVADKFLVRQCGSDLETLCSAQTYAEPCPIAFQRCPVCAA